MTAPLRLLVFAAAAALSLTFAGCAASPASPASTSAPAVDSSAPAEPDDSPVVEGACTDAAGVTVVVDPGTLASADAPATTHCVAADETIGAAEAFEIAGVTTEGTVEYGDQIVCRVNGVPSEDTVLIGDDGAEYNETCESMPAASAYWSLWIKPADGEWGYANEGLATQTVEPGQSVELLFVVNGEPAAPAA